MIVSGGRKSIDAFAIRGWSVPPLGFRRSRSSAPAHRYPEFPPRLDIVLSTRVRSVAGPIGGCFSANRLYHRFVYSKPMPIRFTPTHVRSAITVVETDHERTTTERDAFASFLHRISDLDVSSVDLQPNRAQQAPTQTLVTPETARHAKSQLVRVMHTVIPS